MESLSKDQLLKIIRAGILAPSADNRHHVRFEVCPGGLKLWADDELRDSAERHREILALISVGAVIENVLLEATAFGFKGAARFFPVWRSSGLIAEIAWQISHASRDILVEAIPLRHTNRRFFHGPGLEPAQQGLLNAEVATIDGVQLSWLEGVERSAALRLVLLAESERFGNEALHRELFSAIRFDVGWTEACEEGLPPGSLEVEPFLRTAFASLRSWKLMRTLNMIGSHRLLGMRAAYLPCRLSPHLGVMTVTGDLEMGAIAIGRAFERLWLRATLLDLAMQPMVASVVLPLYEGTRGVSSERAESVLESGWAKLTPLRTPLMFFRLGRARPPKVTTARRPINSYMRQSLANAQLT